MTPFVHRLILLLSVALWATNVQAQARIDRNVVYGMYSGLALLMDVHYPQRPNGFGILCVPGSGWNALLGYDARPLKDGAERDGFAKALIDAGQLLQASLEIYAPLTDAQFVSGAAVENRAQSMTTVKVGTDRIAHVDEARN